ncbi:uncharacterized protein MYCFIDRAFT_89763 [Pseudocercospora fijiensis CIRAD86]|uniref:Transcription factor domain-containing protein n=1 Tax=Pseudocercospora fijiensis (strain CIRAD86) TaxID=383855 RepID=M3AR70_PSEFD|nr:uncharacterized protein MYCFIDRAFT_89763 [Pseudocercospora fijiensis CIRAD86]EME87106.1 hypothetical protein MYCFIDRAFT_89763 [Pseudocercospora fijiensis CIRAD86]
MGCIISVNANRRGAWNGLECILCFQRRWYIPYTTALTAVFAEGFIFVALTILGLRQWLARAIPHSIKMATTVGVGLFLTLISLTHSAGIGLVQGASSSPLELAGCSAAFFDERAAGELLHVWTTEFPTRGRSHYSFYLGPFKPLLAFAQDDAPATQSPDPLRAAESGAYDGQEISVNPGRSHERHAQHIQGQASANIYDEIPSKETAGLLLERYFDTFNKVCPILYRPTFEIAFNAMLEDPRSVKICFVMEALMVLALGNATLPEQRQVVTQDVALGWLDLAASAPSTAMDLREFDIDTVRMWALINFTRQLLKLDPVADYIFTGSALRAGMVIGLHRPSAWAKGGNRRGLWEALVGLDLQACIASGSPPSLPWLHLDSQLSASEAANLADDDSTTRHLHDIRLGRALSRSLSVRYKIAHLLNVETHAPFDTAISLGRALTQIMAPALSSDSPHDKSFQHRFVNGIYRSFLSAVHRPFATLDLAAYHYSRDLSIALATQHLQDVIAALDPSNTPDHFDRLLSGYGAFFKLETYHAVLMLSYHIYHKSEEQLALEAAGINSRAADRENTVRLIRRYLDAVQGHDAMQDHVPQPHLIASLVLAHFYAPQSPSSGCADYRAHIAYQGSRAMRGDLLPGPGPLN